MEGFAEWATAEPPFDPQNFENMCKPLSQPTIRCTRGRPQECIGRWHRPLLCTVGACDAKKRRHGQQGMPPLDNTPSSLAPPSSPPCWSPCGCHTSLACAKPHAHKIRSIVRTVRRIAELPAAGQVESDSLERILSKEQLKRYMALKLQQKAPRPPNG